MKQKANYNIVVAGGGTAGWSTAALLSTNSNINVTVIEPSDIPTIGVGESTIPYINVVHTKMNMRIFDTPDWLAEVNGTLKFSIEFADYHRKGHKWIHPFNSTYSLDNVITAQACAGELPLEIYSGQDDFVNDCYVFANLRSKQFTPYTAQYDYYFTPSAGYHIDAGLYGNMLKRESLKRDNCHHIDSSIVDIAVGEDEYVSSITLKNGERLTKQDVDLFVDCTGFRGLLANAVGAEWNSDYSERLFVDTAIAVQLPYINEDLQLRNTTYCHALGYGWSWNVPLQNRIGTGYVFSSKHTTIEQATEEFKQHLHETYGYDKDSLKFRTVPFRTGLRNETWKNNVVAVGLSSFFLEPIESTAIAHLHHQADTILEMLNSTHISMENKRKRFNYLNKISLDAIASYIEMHYIFSERRDTSFWKEFTDLKLTDDQKYILKKYVNKDEKFDLKGIFEGHSLFDINSHLFLFLGFDIKPNQMTNRVSDYLS